MPVSLTVQFLSRFDPFQGFVSSRPTFVYRCQACSSGRNVCGVTPINVVAGGNWRAAHTT
jgi:hypothetical protein